MSEWQALVSPRDSNARALEINPQGKILCFDQPPARSLTLLSPKLSYKYGVQKLEGLEITSSQVEGDKEMVRWDSRRSDGRMRSKKQERAGPTFQWMASSGRQCACRLSLLAF